MHSAEKECFTIEEIETATLELLAQAPVTFDGDICFSGDYFETDKARIAGQGCICLIELKEPENKLTIIGQFRADRHDSFDQRIWVPETDNIIARIARANRLNGNQRNTKLSA